MEEENGIEGRKGSRKREARVWKRRVTPSLFRFAGGACSDSASVAFSPSRPQNSEASIQPKVIANLIVLPGNYLRCHREIFPLALANLIIYRFQSHT